MIKKENFEDFLNSINLCYAEGYKRELPTTEDFPLNLFDNDHLNISVLEKLSDDLNNIFLASVSKRILGIILIQRSRDNGSDLDLKKSWNYIAQSIKIIPSEATISSIGSQGFLSIPLYKFDKDLPMFEFIRLHIWDKSLDEYINNFAKENFSIHTHCFHAHSWIITGKIINDRYIVKESKEPASFVRFDINYNKTLDKINQHSSTAVSKCIYVTAQQISHEIYMSGSSYQIKAQSYHNSDTVDDEIAATFFSFSAKNGIVDTSFVVGPATQTKSEINRKMHIDPKYLLEKIESKQINLL